MVIPMIDALLWAKWANDGVLIDAEELFFQATRDALRSVGRAHANPNLRVLNLGRAQDGSSHRTTILTSSNRLPIPTFPRSTSYRAPSREPGGISRTICRLDSTTVWP